MPETPAAPVISTANRVPLREALDFLQACKVDVLIDGDRYSINGEPMTEWEMISFARMLSPDIVKLAQ